MLRYAITDRHLTLPGQANTSPQLPDVLPQRCAELARDGVDFILVREKDLPPTQLAALSRRVIAAVRHTGAPTKILIAQRLDIACAVQADGLHLSSTPGELLPAQIRQLLPHAFVTVSCHTLDEVRHAREASASAALLAPIFGKSIAGREVTPPVGLDTLQAACTAAAPMPVLALGGITPANAPQCLAAGAAGIAGIRLFFLQPHRATV